MSKLIVSSILIYLNNPDDIAKMDFLRSYPYALHRKKKILIVMNQQHNFQKIRNRIKSFNSVSGIAIHHDEISDFRGLYEFCDSQIRQNLAGKENIGKLIEFANGPGMSRYYFRLRCYKNLNGIDAETYTRLGTDK